MPNVADPGQWCRLFDSHCRKRIQWYGAVTKDLILERGDSIQFALVSPKATVQSRDWVALEYSLDGGLDWKLVQEDCLRLWLNCRQMRQSSRIDYALLAGREQQLHYYVTQDMADR